MTGANNFFTFSEATRIEYKLTEDQLVRISPPGTRHLRGISFRASDWEGLREAGERVWMLHPDADDKSRNLARYIAHGQSLEVNAAYKCRIREPWWCPPVVAAPDLFFTYMSHRYPRLVANSAKVTFVNSMHGLRLRAKHRKLPKTALPLLAFNSVTMIGAEVNGRSYGGGILKMEPREASRLPVPSTEHLLKAWACLRRMRKQSLTVVYALGCGRMWSSELTRCCYVTLWGFRARTLYNFPTRLRSYAAAVSAQMSRSNV